MPRGQVSLGMLKPQSDGCSNPALFSKEGVLSSAQLGHWPLSADFLCQLILSFSLAANRMGLCSAQSVSGHMQAMARTCLSSAISHTYLLEITLLVCVKRDNL